MVSEMLVRHTALQKVCSPLDGHSLKKRKQGIVLEKAVIMKRGKHSTWGVRIFDEH